MVCSPIFNAEKSREQNIYFYAFLPKEINGKVKINFGIINLQIIFEVSLNVTAILFGLLIYLCFSLLIVFNILLYILH
jgi:hypothetical protein